jgi:hypothetical protein
LTEQPTAENRRIPAVSNFDPHQFWMAAAIAWAALLIPFAILFPVHTVNTGRAGVQPRHTAVQDFGYPALLLSAVPLIVSVGVGALVRHHRTTGRSWSLVLAWLLAATMLLAGLVGLVTIVVGFWLIPAGLLLCAAAYTGTTDRRSERT